MQNAILHYITASYSHLGKVLQVYLLPNAILGDTEIRMNPKISAGMSHLAADYGPEVCSPIPGPDQV
jgi:hypothetical protein